LSLSTVERVATTTDLRSEKATRGNLVDLTEGSYERSSTQNEGSGERSRAYKEKKDRETGAGDPRSRVLLVTRKEGEGSDEKRDG